MNPLKKEELCAVIEGRKNAGRVPLIYHIWVAPEVFGQRKEEAARIIQDCPYDVEQISLRMPDVFDAPPEDPDYRWCRKENRYADTSVGLDARIAIEDWSELDEVLEHFPSAQSPCLFPQVGQKGEKYRLIHWWYWLFERLWSLRGMENSLTDFYTDPESIHRLFERLTDFYCDVLDRAKKELDADGVFLSDDIGTQTGPFFSLELFQEFFKPYYKRFIEKAHSLSMHVWMHSCGNIELYLPELIEIGLDVIHPIQKHTMDEAEIARRYGDQICILAGFDVQQTIPYGTPDQVRAEARHLIDTFARPNGRFMLTMGNGITPDCPLESLEALFDESTHYAVDKIRQFSEK